MFDESGSDSIFRSPQPAKQKQVQPIGSEPKLGEKQWGLPVESEPKPVAESRRSPRWVRVVGFYILYLAATRFVEIFNVERFGDALVLLANVVVLIIVFLGFSGMRRWGAYLLMIFCAWRVVSLIFIGIYRLSVLDGVVESSGAQQWIASVQTLNIIGGTFLASALGLWVAYQLKKFRKAKNPAPRVGLTYVVIAGIFMMHTALQYANTETYLDNQAEVYQENINQNN